MSLDFTVSVNDLKNVATRLLTTIPAKAMREAVDEVAAEAANELMNLSPSSMKSGRGYRGPPLRLSVTNEKVSGGRYVYNKKRVGGLYLGTMIVEGSSNTRVIFPVTAKRLRFMWRGSLWFAKHVHRGVIAPNNFVAMAGEFTAVVKAPIILQQVFLRHYQGGVK